MSGVLVSVQSDSFTRLCFRVFSGRVKRGVPSVSHRRRGSVTQAKRAACGLNLSAAARHFNSQLRGLRAQLIGVSLVAAAGLKGLPLLHFRWKVPARPLESSFMGFWSKGCN